MPGTALQVVTDTIANTHARFSQMAKAGGGYVDFETEARYALQIIKRSSALMRCEPHSLEEAVYNIAGIGLSLNPALGHAALIPRRSSDDKKTYCHFDPMYRGLIKLATDGGSIKAVQAAAVYEEEVHAGNFKMTRGTSPEIIHNVDPLMKLEQLGEMVGCYCVADVAGGMKHTTWMPIDEIMKIAERSESFNPRNPDRKPSGPWVSDFQEMAVKTVIKRARKQWPLGNDRLDRAVQLANHAEGYIEPKPDDLPGEADAVDLINVSQGKELRQMCKGIHLRVARVYEKYEIRKMELLPADKYKECRTNLLKAAAHHAAKHSEKGDSLYADDYEMKLDDLEGIASIYQSQATLRTKRDDEK
jgi:phage RecT family recombinase